MHKWARTAAAIISITSLAMGEDAAEGLEHETTIAIGLNATDGNSETANLNGTVTTHLEWEKSGSLDIGIESNYGKQTVGDVRKTSVDNGKITANGKRLFAKRSFAYLETSARRDDIALINYRTTLGPGIGTHLLKRKGLKLLVEVGASYVFEDVDGVKDDYVSLRLAQEYRQKLNDHATIWQSLTYFPRAEELNRYLAEAELGAESALSERISVRVVLQNKHDSMPPEGVDKDDTTLIAAIGIKL